MRASAERFARAAISGRWRARALGGHARGGPLARGGGPCRARIALAEDVELYPRKERKRIETEWGERIRRSRRRVETAALDLALQVVALWFADLACLAWGARDLVRNVDRSTELESDSGLDPQRLRSAVEAVEDTRLRFQLNVSEELACESLAYRLERLLAE